MDYLINSKKAKLTESEIIILNYLNENITNIPILKLEDVTEKTHTSCSSVVRLSKKLGFEGFKDLKTEYIKMLNKNDDNLENHLFIGTAIAAFYQLDKMNSVDDYKKAVKIIENARQIIIVGSGTSKIIADVAALSLREKAYIARSSDTSVAEQKTLKHLTSSDLVIFVSYSGETKSIIESLNSLSKNVNKISITSSNESTLSKMSNQNLFVPIVQEDFKHISKISRLTRMLVIDVLISMVPKKNLQNK